MHTIKKDAIVIEIFFDKIIPAVFTVKMLTESVTIKSEIFLATNIACSSHSLLLFIEIILLHSISIAFFH